MARLVVGLSVSLSVAAGLTSASPGAVVAPVACSVGTTLNRAPPGRPHYALHVRVEPGLMKAKGDLTVSFAPSAATDRLVFRLWPNSPFYAKRGARLTVSSVSAAGHRVVPARPDPTTLVIRRRLAAHEQVTVSMRWALHLPSPAGLQLHGGGSARLLSFFPLLAWTGTDWATEPPVATDSFWSTSPTADFDVRVSVPRQLRVLGSGEEVSPGRWRALGVRDFALAVGSFRVTSRTVTAPRPVRLTVGLERGSSYPVREFLAAAADALRFYAKRYGDYPWSTYSLAVMNDFVGLGGTAYPTLGFLGDASLVLVPHETAHQWFYSIVGNDQSRDPWLSEGLATWAQTGPENSMSTMLNTSIPPEVRNRIGKPMSFWQTYEFEAVRTGLFVQTVQALASLGDERKIDCALRTFVVRNAFRTATPRDLLGVLQSFFPHAEEKLRAYGASF